MSSASNSKGRPLPKFGDWNNPASADGFTAIFNKARDQKKTNVNPSSSITPTPQPSDQKNNSTLKKLLKKWLRWFVRN